MSHDTWGRWWLGVATVAFLGLTACTGGSGRAGGESGSSTTASTAAFGGLAANVPVGSGRVGADWWVRSPATASAVPSAAKAAVLADQRYRVLAAWIAGRNAVVHHLSTAAVINTLADGAGRDYLGTLPPPVTAPQDQLKVFGETRWTIIGAATKNPAGWNVTTCGAEYVRAAGPPTPARLRDALQAQISVSTDLVVDENGTWLVLTPALSASTKIPPGCAAWAARLRKQAGLVK